MKLKYVSGYDDTFYIYSLFFKLWYGNIQSTQNQSGTCDIFLILRKSSLKFSNVLKFPDVNFMQIALYFTLVII